MVVLMVLCLGIVLANLCVFWADGISKHVWFFGMIGFAACVLYDIRMDEAVRFAVVTREETTSAYASASNGSRSLTRAKLSEIRAASCYLKCVNMRICAYMHISPRFSWVGEFGFELL